MFKRYIAKRKLIRHCDFCNKKFLKRSVYYKKREVIEDWDSGRIYGKNQYKCPKCKYKEEQHFKRQMKFMEKCKHPKQFIETEYGYIYGECAKEPLFDYCRLCGKVL